MVLNQLKRFKEKIGMSKTDMGRDFRFWEGNRHFLHEIEKKNNGTVLEVASILE